MRLGPHRKFEILATGLRNKSANFSLALWSIFLRNDGCSANCYKHASKIGSELKHCRFMQIRFARNIPKLTNETSRPRSCQCNIVPTVGITIGFRYTGAIERLAHATSQRSPHGESACSARYLATLPTKLQCQLEFRRVKVSRKRKLYLRIRGSSCR
jgi:hypothetical protein